MKIRTSSFLAGGVGAAMLLGVAAASADTVVIDGTNQNSITNGVNTWYATNTYVLEKFVFIEAGEEVHIQPGTVIKARAETGANSSALFVTRGGKLFANGTPEKPIVFTSALDSTVGDAVDFAQKVLDPATESGKWGGIIMLGNAVLNSAADSIGDAATPKYDVYEGVSDNVIFGTNVFRFGGSDDTDSSGALRYVSIRYTGVQLAQDKELNGLTLGGVGSGTVLDHVEIYGGTDDGFEWWGGTVSGKYLAASYIQDDIFDCDQGYRGKNQFVFGWAFNNGTQATDKGMELDGEVGTVDGSTPISRYEFRNVTLLGAGGQALKIRDHSALRMHNSIITGFGGGLDWEADNQAAFDAGEVVITHNIFQGTSHASDSDVTGGSVYFTDAARKNQNLDPMLLKAVAPFDLRPKAGSPALDSNNALTGGDPFFTPAPFLGAFSEQESWLRGWSALSQKGQLVSFGAAHPTVANVITVTKDDIHGKTYWTKDYTYVLDGFVFVEDGEELHIEAGTVIKAKSATGANSSALFVTRGGKLFAVGSRQAPIIFTSILDSSVGATGLDLGEKELNPETESGKWGGITLLGRGVLNSAADGLGDAATPKYDIYEGQPDSVFNGANVFRFGGSDDNDSSGVLRYVSIRYTGVQLAQDKELNGLTMGGVGGGTVLDHVEVYGGTDDGFEWWGGTVNGKYLAASYIQDDIYDMDQGYRGKIQNVFGWAFNNGTEATDKGMELDGEVGTVDGSAPVSRYEIHNGTFLGAGGKAIKIRDHSAVRVYNSIFTGWNGGLDWEADNQAALDAGEVVISHNIWEGTSFGSDADVTGGDVFFTDTLRKNQNLNPALRSTTGVLDLRPLAGSPALDGANVNTSVAGGFIEARGYLGAFDGVGNWLEGWSALSSKGKLFKFGTAGTITISGTDQNSITDGMVWSNNWTYVLDKFTYVEANETLHIQPGTVIKAKADTGANSTALFVTRGGKIMADGTRDNPIVFTSVLDATIGATGLDLGEKVLDPATESGKWGGIILLGNAVLNSAADSTGDAATPKYDVYEGVSDNVVFGTNVFRFGGNDDNDNSGMLRYVSIRYTGVQLAQDKELNGLTIAGVGSATVLENVEVYGGTDDGFEWWGGTVNGKYLVASFIQDDIFDMDQGYRGKNQFLLGWAFNNGTEATDKGMELDGEVGTVDGSLPVADYSVYNATLLGAGGKAIKLRDHSGLNLHNSVISGFNGGLDYEPDQQAAFDAGELVISFNIFEGASHSADSEVTGGDVYFTDAARRNINVNPEFVRAGADRISPFPGVGSPVFAAENRKAEPAGFYSNVDFIGAFGDVNWAADWTELSRRSQLSGLGAGVPNYPLSAGGPSVNNTAIAAAIPAAVIGAGGGLMITLPAGAITDATSYQWQVNTGSGYVDVPGATTGTLNLASAVPGSYRVVVSNSEGSANSADIPVVRVTIVYIGGVKVEGPAAGLQFQSGADVNNVAPVTGGQSFDHNGMKYYVDPNHDGNTVSTRFFRVVPANP